MGAKEQWPSAKRIAIQSQLDSRENAELDREADARLYAELCENRSLLHSVLFGLPDSETAELYPGFELNDVLLSLFSSAELETVHANRPVKHFGYRSRIDGLPVNEHQHRTVCESVIARMVGAVSWCRSNGVEAVPLIDAIHNGESEDWWVKVCDVWGNSILDRQTDAVAILMEVDARRPIGRVFDAFESAAWEAIQPKPSKVLQEKPFTDESSTEEPPTEVEERKRFQVDVHGYPLAEKVGDYQMYLSPLEFIRWLTNELKPGTFENPQEASDCVHEPQLIHILDSRFGERKAQYRRDFDELKGLPIRELPTEIYGFATRLTVAAKLPLGVSDMTLVEVITRYEGWLQTKKQSKPRRRGRIPDPDAERVEKLYRSRSNLRYAEIARELNLEAFNGRTPEGRVKRIINAYHKRLERIRNKNEDA